MMKNLLKQQTVALEKANAALTRETRQRQEAQSHPKETHTEIEHLIASIAATVMGRPMSQCGMDWDWEKIEAGITRSREQHGSVRVDDIPFRCSNDEQRYLGITINPLNGDGRRILGLTIIGADITERKKLEARLQQSHKMEAIGQLAAGIAHEINTPTQFVGDNTRFLQDAFGDMENLLDTYARLAQAARTGAVTPELLDEVKAAEERADLDYLKEEIPQAISQSLEGIQRVSKIVRAMKDFSHPGGEGKEAVDLNKAIESTITVARNEWKYVAEMVLNFDPSLPPVPCLAGDFNQVILNIVINAAHAIADVVGDGSHGKGTISISTRCDGDWAEIRISDTGTGIPEDHRSRVFDHFFTTKEVGKGTGQGLAIAYSVVTEKHGGTITFESETGKGTTFIIRLPIDPDLDNAEEAPRHEAVGVLC